MRNVLCCIATEGAAAIMFQTSRHVLIQYRYNGSSTVSSEGSCRRRCRGDERADI